MPEMRHLFPDESVPARPYGIHTFKYRTCAVRVEQVEVHRPENGKMRGVLSPVMGAVVACFPSVFRPHSLPTSIQGYTMGTTCRVKIPTGIRMSP